MDQEKVEFDTPGQELAITGSDEDIYPYLPWCKHVTAIRSEVRGWIPDPWSDIRVTPEQYHPAYARRPQRLPFTFNDLQDFLSKGHPPPWTRWSVRCASGFKHSSDTTYSDGFRGVFVFRTIEFMIRPLLHEGTGPGRLHFTTNDVINCLRAAITFHSQNPSEQMRTIIGTASAPDSDEVRGNPLPKVPLEWRIDRAVEEKVSREVTSWRKRQFHPTNPEFYKQAKKAYDEQRKAEIRAEKARQRGPSTQPGQGMHSGRKRRGSGSDSPSSPGPSHKRRSMGSQAGTISSSQSVTSSPELSRSSSFTTSGTMDQEQPRYPGPADMLLGAPVDTGYSSGSASSYAQTPTGSPESTRSGSSQSMISGVSRGISGLAITSPGGYGGQNALAPPMGYRPRPVPMQMLHPRPAPGQSEGYGTPQYGDRYSGYSSNPPRYGQISRDMPPPPIPPQMYPPQGMPYNAPSYQGMGASPQGGGYSPYPYQGPPADSQSDLGDDGHEDPRAVYLYRGRNQSGSRGPYGGGGGGGGGGSSRG